MTIIDGDKIVSIQIYDDEHEIFIDKKMSIIDLLDSYTDEGVTIADDLNKASEALEDIGEISSCLVSIMEWESCYYQRKDIYEKAKKWQREEEQEEDVEEWKE